MRNRTSTDLQQNVYQNRTQFIKISKEAEKLKGEMRALRNLMSELKSNTTALRAASSTAAVESTGFDESFPSTLSKKDRRSSVADRTALWTSQLQVFIHSSLPMPTYHSFNIYMKLTKPGIVEECGRIAKVSTRRTWSSCSSECRSLGGT